MARAESPISLLFSGQFRSTVKRPGTKDSITFEPFNCLQLEVDHRAIQSLDDSFAFLSRPESINSGSITKRITLDTLPMILVIQLKRFVFRNGKSEKICKFVSYPERLLLDKRIYTQSPQEIASGLPSYRLFAVVNHHGRMSTGGHYTVDVRKSFKQDEFWLRINDTFINRISLEQVLRERHEANAYLLFYQKTKDFKQHNL
jgi:ubiquitin carboxyl-terminal hydrolase 10